MVAAAKSTSLTDANLIAVLKGLQGYLAGDLTAQAAADTIKNALMFEDTKTTNEKSTPAKRGKAKPEPEPEEDDEDDDDEEDDEEDDERTLREAELNGMKIVGLRKIAIAAGFGKADVDEADKETLVESILDDEFSGSGGGDADDDDEDDEEDDEYTRADLLKMSIAALRKIAKDEYEATAADLKGLDKDGIADLILGEGDDEDEDDEDDDEDADDEDGAYSEEDLAEMSLAELKEIAKEWGLRIKAGAKSPTYVKAILDAQEEDEDDEDDE